MKKIFFVILLLFIIAFFNSFYTFKKVDAESITESIEKQLEQLDFSSLEDSLNNFSDRNFIDYLKDLLNGNYSIDFSNIKDVALNIINEKINIYLPIFISIFSINLLCSIINKLKGGFSDSSISNLVYLICNITSCCLLFSSFYSIYYSIKSILQNLYYVNETLSPILITLMVASGGNISAKIYSSTSVIFSNLINIITTDILLPLIIIYVVLSLVNQISTELNLNGFCDVIASIIKWIIGLIIAVFGIVFSVKGISTSVYDGISIKATKYAISNSIPIVGSLLKDSFDLIVAGSVLIKNSIGVVVIFLLFFYMLNPILDICIFSLFLKISNGVSELIFEKNNTSFFKSLSKSLTYLNVVFVSVLLIFFVNILLIIISANSFI